MKATRETDMEWKGDAPRWHGHPRRHVIVGAEYSISQIDNRPNWSGIPATRWWFQIDYQLPSAEDSSRGYRPLMASKTMAVTAANLEQAKIFAELDHLQRTKTRCEQLIKKADYKIQSLQERLREFGELETSEHPHSGSEQTS